MHLDRPRPSKSLVPVVFAALLTAATGHAQGNSGGISVT